MPVGGRAGGASVTVRGGRRLERILMRYRGLTAEKLAEFTADVLRQELLPVLKSRVPRRTGRMARSLEIRRRGARVELRGVWYGPFVNRNTNRPTVEETAMDILAADKARIVQLIVAKVRAFVGV